MGEWVGELVGQDVWETRRQLVPVGSVLAFLAGHRGALFPAAMFEDMYPSVNGRPSMPPQILAVAITLQAPHGLSDFETVQELRCDLRWKAACGLGLNNTAFDPSLLAYFRRRLARSSRPDRVFEAEVLRATGTLKGKHRRALDSTVLDDAVATQDTAIRMVIREAPRRRPERGGLKPAPLKTTVVGGFSLDDFTINSTSSTVTCPTGHTATLSEPSGRRMRRKALFTDQCTGYPLRERCTTAKSGRIVTFRPHHELLATAHRQAAADPG